MKPELCIRCKAMMMPQAIQGVLSCPICKSVIEIDSCCSGKPLDQCEVPERKNER